MIYLITGKIGSGKSLLALTKGVEQLAMGGCWMTNIALNEENVDRYLHKYHKRRLVEGQIQIHDFESEPMFQKAVPFGTAALNVMVTCDECQLYYNQADASRLQSQYSKLVSFLTQSRKCKVDVWFVTQKDTTVWAQFRHQALFGYRCRDMRAVNLPFVGNLSEIQKLPLLGKLLPVGLNWAKFDTDSGETMETGRTALRQDLFSLYDTTQMYDSQMRDLQQEANTWEPAPASQQGKYETDSDFADRTRASRFFRL